MMQASANVDIASILDSMPRARFQKTIIKKSEGRHPYWYMRPRVDVITPEGKRGRKLKRISLGRVSREFGKHEAEARANQIMRTINRADYMIQSQIRFADFLEIYRREHVLRRDGDRYFLSASTQEKYTNHLRNHIEPTFSDLMLCEINAQMVDAWLSEKSKPRSVKIGDKDRAIPGLSWATHGPAQHHVFNLHEGQGLGLLAGRESDRTCDCRTQTRRAGKTQADG